MHLVQILLPLSDNSGRRFASGEYARVRAEMTEHFGGITQLHAGARKGNLDGRRAHGA